MATFSQDRLNAIALGSVFETVPHFADEVAGVRQYRAPVITKRSLRKLPPSEAAVRKQQLAAAQKSYEDLAMNRSDFVRTRAGKESIKYKEYVTYMLQNSDYTLLQMKAHFEKLFGKKPHGTLTLQFKKQLREFGVRSKPSVVQHSEEVVGTDEVEEPEQDLDALQKQYFTQMKENRDAINTQVENLRKGKKVKKVKKASKLAKAPKVVAEPKAPKKSYEVDLNNLDEDDIIEEGIIARIMAEEGYGDAVVNEPEDWTPLPINDVNEIENMLDDVPVQADVIAIEDDSDNEDDDEKAETTDLPVNKGAMLEQYKGKKFLHKYNWIDVHDAIKATINETYPQETAAKLLRYIETTTKVGTNEEMSEEKLVRKYVKWAKSVYKKKHGSNPLPKNGEYIRNAEPADETIPAFQDENIVLESSNVFRIQPFHDDSLDHLLPQPTPRKQPKPLKKLPRIPKSQRPFKKSTKKVVEEKVEDEVVEVPQPVRPAFVIKPKKERRPMTAERMVKRANKLDKKIQKQLRRSENKPKPLQTMETITEIDEDKVDELEDEQELTRVLMEQGEQIEEDEKFERELTALLLKQGEEFEREEAAQKAKALIVQKRLERKAARKARKQAGEDKAFERQVLADEKIYYREKAAQDLLDEKNIKNVIRRGPRNRGRKVPVPVKKLVINLDESDDENDAPPLPELVEQVHIVDAQTQDADVAEEVIYNAEPHDGSEIIYNAEPADEELVLPRKKATTEKNDIVLEPFKKAGLLNPDGVKKKLSDVVIQVGATNAEDNYPEPPQKKLAVELTNNVQKPPLQRLVPVIMEVELDDPMTPRLSPVPEGKEPLSTIREARDEGEQDFTGLVNNLFDVEYDTDYDPTEEMKQEVPPAPVLKPVELPVMKPIKRKGGPPVKPTSRFQLAKVHKAPEKDEELEELFLELFCSQGPIKRQIAAPNSAPRVKVDIKVPPNKALVDVSSAFAQPPVVRKNAKGKVSYKKPSKPMAVTKNVEFSSDFPPPDHSLVTEKAQIMARLNKRKLEDLKKDDDSDGYASDGGLWEFDSRGRIVFENGDVITQPTGRAKSPTGPERYQLSGRTQFNHQVLQGEMQYFHKLCDDNPGKVELAAEHQKQLDALDTMCAPKNAGKVVIKVDDQSDFNLPELPRLDGPRQTVKKFKRGKRKGRGRGGRGWKGRYAAKDSAVRFRQPLPAHGEQVVGPVSPSKLLLQYSIKDPKETIDYGF